MKKVVIRSIFFLSLAAATASAATVLCADQTNDSTGVGGNTLDKYIALNSKASPGCMIGNLLFSNFAYSDTLGADAYYPGTGAEGTGDAQSSNVVLVSVNPANDKFQFSANWIVNHYQTETLSLSFTVSAPTGNQLKTLQNTFTATHGGSQNGGPTHTTSATCTGGTCGSPTIFTNDDVNVAPTPGVLTIVNSVFLNAKGSTGSSTNNYDLSSITDQFEQTSSGDNSSNKSAGVPEPAPYLLTSAGLGVIGLWRRRKQA